MKNIIGKLQKKGKEMRNRQSRKQAKLVKHLLDCREQAKMYFDILLPENEFPPEYTIPLKKTFNVFHAYSCREVYGVDIGHTPVLSFKEHAIDASIFNLMIEFGFRMDEAKSVYDSVSNAISAFECFITPWPKRDCCMAFWRSVINHQGILDAITRMYSGDFVVPEKPRFFQQLSIVGLHLVYMERVARFIYEDYTFGLVCPGFKEYEDYFDESILN